MSDFPEIVSTNSTTDSKELCLKSTTAVATDAIVVFDWLKWWFSEYYRHRTRLKKLQRRKQCNFVEKQEYSK